jgi:hypothetical protein
MRKGALASPVKLPLAQPGTRKRACGAFTGQHRVILQVVAGYGVQYRCFTGLLSHTEKVCRAPMRRLVCCWWLRASVWGEADAGQELDFAIDNSRLRLQPAGKWERQSLWTSSLMFRRSARLARVEEAVEDCSVEPVREAVRFVPDAQPGQGWLYRFARA